MKRSRRASPALTSILPIKQQHPWQRWADLIVEHGGIVKARSRGFTIMLPDGARDVEFDGRLTGKHYVYFAPLLDEWGKTMLAQAVLDNQMCLASVLDRDTAWWLLRKRYGANEEDWLPGLLESQGVAVVAEEATRALTEYRKTNPPPRITCWVFDKPRFDSNSGFLFWGSNRWHFRKQPGEPVWDSLVALEAAGFPFSIKLAHLSPEQVRDAARVLRLKTKRVIKWHGASDCQLSWSLP